MGCPCNIEDNTTLDTKVKDVSKLHSILEGWKNVFWLSQDDEVKAKERAIICADCEKNKLGICTKCGCVLIAKIRSPHEVCPLKKW